MALQLVSFVFPLLFFHSVPLLGHSCFIDAFRALDRYLIPYFIGFLTTLASIVHFVDIELSLFKLAA